MATDLTNYFNSIASIRSSLVSMEMTTAANATVNTIASIAENAALGTIFQGVAQQAKVIADANVAQYYDTIPESNLSAPANVNSVRTDLLSMQIGTMKDFIKKGVIDGIFTGNNATSTTQTPNGQVSTNDFSFTGTQPEVSVPTAAFVAANADKLHLFKSLSGVGNIPDLYTKNAIAAAANKKYSDNRNANKFVNATVASFRIGPPQTAADIDSQNNIVGTTLANQQTFTIGATPLQPAQPLFKSWLPKARTSENNIGVPYTPSNTAVMQNQAMSQKINDLLKQQTTTVGSYKFFIEKMHGRHTYSSNGSLVPYQKNPVTSTAGKFRPAELENRMVFPAYITAFNDSYDSSWDSYDFIGRGEPFWAWKSTTRTLTLEFYMMSDVSTQLLAAAANAVQSAQSQGSGGTNGQNPSGVLKNTTNLTSTSQTVQNNSSTSPQQSITDNTISASDKLKGLQDLFPDWGLGVTPIVDYATAGRTGTVAGEISGTPDQLWERATFLSQCCYGYYRTDGKLKEQPIVRIRIGDFFDVIAIVTSLNNTQDELDMDLNISTTVGAIPTAIKVSMNLTIIHEDEPHSEYRKFYHRKDRDNANTGSPSVPDSFGVTGDSILNKNQTKSPISPIARNQTPVGTMAFPPAASAYEASLANLDNSLKSLSTSGGSLKDAAKRDKLIQALAASVQFLKLAKAYQALTLPIPAATTSGLQTSMANQPLNKSINQPMLFPNMKPNSNSNSQQVGLPG